MLGVAIDRSELPVAEGPAAELGRLYDRVWLAVSRDYVRQNGLEATPEEIAEVVGYEREFERRDRGQRAEWIEMWKMNGALYETLAARPSIMLAPEQVGFTPYWKRPIPPSYFPD